MRHSICLCLLVLCFNTLAAAPPSILTNTSHAIDSADAGLTVLGIPHLTTAGPSNSTLVVNQTCPGGCSSPLLSASSIINYATNTSQTEFAANSNAVVTPSVPYQVISQSSTGYSVAGYERSSYSALMTSGIVYSMAYCGTPTSSDYPPVAFVTVLPNNSPAMAVGASGCGYAQGIEFSIPVNSSNCLPSSCTWTPISGGLSVNVSSPSATTAVMSAVLAALKYNHPLWTWGDVKSVLRSTASNWQYGYVPFSANGPAYGYGNINYPAANSYAGMIYLQPPGFAMQASETTATITLYPFMTSRRAGEVVYSFLQRPVLPSPSANSEYTYSQIAALVSTYGGSLIYNSNGTNGVRSFNYAPPTNAFRYIVAFTVDDASNLAAANYSRAEELLIRRADFGAAKRQQIIMQSFFD